MGKIVKKSLYFKRKAKFQNVTFQVYNPVHLPLKIFHRQSEVKIQSDLQVMCFCQQEKLCTFKIEWNLSQQKALESYNGRARHVIERFYCTLEY